MVEEADLEYVTKEMAAAWRAQSSRGEARAEQGRSSQIRPGRSDQGTISGRMMPLQQARAGDRLGAGSSL